MTSVKEQGQSAIDPQATFLTQRGVHKIYDRLDEETYIKVLKRDGGKLGFTTLLDWGNFLVNDTQMQEVVRYFEQFVQEFGDPAMVKAPGGIDFNAQNLDLKE